MTKTVTLAVLFAFVLSCSSDKGGFDEFDDSIEQAEGEGTISDENEEAMDGESQADDNGSAATGAIIETDYSDLQSLPNDNGGEQIGFPTGTTSSPYGHYVYTPSEYGKDNTEYPLIVFLHGYSSRGDSGRDPTELERILVAGPPSQVGRRDRWNPRFPCVVASPQLTAVRWTANNIHEFIKYIIDHYNVDESRIYLTGLSHGGDGSWGYTGTYGDQGYASAVVPIAGSGNPSQAENLGTVPIWAFHGANDNIVPAYTRNGSVPMVNAINSSNPLFRAKLTIYLNRGHNSWADTYETQGFPDDEIDGDPFDIIIYDWMFQYKKAN